MTFVAPDSIERFDSIVCIGQSALPLQSKHDCVFLHPLNQSYEVFAEEYVIAMLVSALFTAHGKPLAPILQNLDIGYLSSESNFSEEECAAIAARLVDSKSLLLLGIDLFLHAQAANICALLALLCDIKIALASPLGTLPHAPAPRSPAPLPCSDGIWLYVMQNAQADSRICGSALFAQIAKLNDGKTYHFTIANLPQSAVFVRANFSGLVGIFDTNAPICGYPFHNITSFKEHV